jgi:glycosyltransferase involved in cell wall biosynthesis
MSTESPILWILAGDRMDAIVLGPMVRYREMAKAAVAAGYRVRLCLDSCSVELPTGVEFRKLSRRTISEIAPGDRVLARISLGPAVLHALFASGLEFDVDFYSISATEALEADDGMPRWRLFQGRRRTALRYLALVRHSRRILVSIPEHQAFLGGLFFSRGDAGSCRIASTLPEHSFLAPMGVPVDPVPSDLPNPYPESIRHRPIFLWGGGIWAWFDVESLLQSFRILQEGGRDPVLFFLCGTNPSGLTSQDAPVRNALSRAAELGLLGRNVHFLEKGASPSELPGYLAHCTAGIMANPERLESVCSWRTRLLDLLWARKPVVVSGYDPLSSAMVRNGQGVAVPSGDAEALARAIADFAPTTRPSDTLADSLRWPRVFAPWLESVRGPFGRRSHWPGIVFWIRFVLGI